MLTEQRTALKEGAFQGVIKNTNLFDIVQLNGMSKVTCALKVTNVDGNEGFIYFKDGEVVHALYRENDGEEAFHDILGLQQGTVKNISGLESPVLTITTRLDALLLKNAAKASNEDKNSANTRPEGESIDPLSLLIDGTAADNEPNQFRTTIEEEPKGKNSDQSMLQPSHQPASNREHVTDIQKILSEFTQITGVHTTCLVGRDGFLLDHVSRDGIDTETIGAIASSGFGSAESIGNQLGEGNLTMTMIEYDNGPVLFAPVGPEAFLVIVADKDTNIGWIRIAIRKNSKKIKELVVMT